MVHWPILAITKKKNLSINETRYIDAGKSSYNKRNDIDRKEIMKKEKWYRKTKRKSLIEYFSLILQHSYFDVIK